MGNRLYYGDNLEVLQRHVATESVDLVYLDPPFNSNRTYNVLFKQRTGHEENAQIQAFDDTWTWGADDEAVYRDLTAGGAPTKAADALEALYRLMGPTDMLSYLVMMTARLIELRRVLKPNGSLYLHCDPTASHYLKILLDAIFGIENYVAEISWKRASAHNDSKRWGQIRDIIFYYSRGRDRIWNTQFGPYDPEYIARDYRHDDGDGRGPWRRGDLTAAKDGGDVSYDWRAKQSPDGRWSADPDDEYLRPKQGWIYRAARPYNGRFWAYSKANLLQLEAEGKIRYTRSGNPEYKRYLSEMPGAPISNHWDDVPAINAGASERLGYPTQKPVALLERIIAASSNPGHVVLDPFCGCGTTIDAAQRLGRQWIGIDITYLAIDLIDTRLRASYGDKIVNTYDIVGIPRDVDAAAALFARNPFDFERWAVSLVDGTPNEKQVGDRGSDGIIKFPIEANAVGRAVVSVKGGGQVNPGMVRDLAGTISAERAEMGILIVMDRVTAGMRSATEAAGTYHHELTGRDYPKVQILSVRELLGGKRPAMPTPFMPYLQAQRFTPAHPTLPGL